MTVNTPLSASTYINTLITQIETADTLNTLQESLQQAEYEVAAMVDYGLADHAVVREAFLHFRQIAKKAEERLAFLNQAKSFSEEVNPRACECTHQRWYTGIFYNSVEMIQCLTCKGWQSIRRVIR